MTGSNSIYLRNLATGSERLLGPSYSDSPEYYWNAFFAFFGGSNDTVVRIAREYRKSDWTLSAHSGAILDATDPSAISESPAPMNFGPYGYYVGYKGNRHFYVVYDENWNSSTHTYSDGTDSVVLDVGKYLMSD